MAAAVSENLAGIESKLSAVALDDPSEPSDGPHFFPTEAIVVPSSTYPASLFDDMRECAARKLPAEVDVKYWGGDPQPWRNGTDNSPIFDPVVLQSEEERKAVIEAEDAAATAGGGAHADLLRACGFPVAFLLAMAEALDIWDWKTWEVVQFLVKPLTENHGRCRGAHLPFLRRFTQPATVFVSHCWGGRWGDVLAAAAAGARRDRVVWLDIFAVRQWAGNAADLDFRGVVERSTAVLVAAAPGADATYSKSFLHKEERQVYIESEEHRASLGVLPFCRLWCIVELYAAVSFSKPIVFQCRAIQAVTMDDAVAATAAATTLTLTDVGLTFNMLLNFSFMVDVTNAACAVEADRVREMATIGEENISRLNKAVSAALMAGSTAANGDCASAVDACLCGEPEAMRSLASAKEVIAALDAACAAGHMAVVKELLDTRRQDIGDLSTQYYPLFIGTRTLDHPTARKSARQNAPASQPPSAPAPNTPTATPNHLSFHERPPRRGAVPFGR